ncbi:MAG: hypothetical protein ACYDG4_13380 [Desulfuromonadaceae bacterium]
MKGLAFNEQMALAWHQGRKTVTRRLMKTQPGKGHLIIELSPGLFVIKNKYRATLGEIKPPYLPGEMVYIKETWRDDGVVFGFTDSMGEQEADVVYYKADGHDQKVKWRSPRFMPEWASRSHALIVSVRPERVQEITEEEAKLEGVTPFRNDPEGDCWTDGTYRKAFEYLWNEIHGWCPNSFELNPWIWRIELVNAVIEKIVNELTGSYLKKEKS